MKTVATKTVLVIALFILAIGACFLSGCAPKRELVLIDIENLPCSKDSCGKKVVWR